MHPGSTKGYRNPYLSIIYPTGFVLSLATPSWSKSLMKATFFGDLMTIGNCFSWVVSPNVSVTTIFTSIVNSDLIEIPYVVKNVNFSVSSRNLESYF